MGRVLRTMRDYSAVVTVAVHKVCQSGGLSYVMPVSGLKDLSGGAWAGTLAGLLESMARRLPLETVFRFLCLVFVSVSASF